MTIIFTVNTVFTLAFVKTLGNDIVCTYSLNVYTRIKLLHVEFLDKLRDKLNFHTPEYEPKKLQRENASLLCFKMTKTMARSCKIQDILTKSNVNDVSL